MYRSHAWDQVEFFQLGQREWAVIDGFNEGHFFTGLQQGIVGGDATIGTQHKTGLAAENPALVVFIAHLDPSLRQ
ncbi:hypothetical protein D3C72_2424920 [compost metagenome]